MNGCQTCGGYGMHHDPIAHDRVTENDEPCVCDTDFTCMADEHEPPSCPDCWDVMDGVHICRPEHLDHVARYRAMRES